MDFARVIETNDPDEQHAINDNERKSRAVGSTRCFTAHSKGRSHGVDAASFGHKLCVDQAEGGVAGGNRQWPG